MLIMPVLLVWLAVAVFVVIEALRKRRASRQYGLLWALAVAAERSLPLEPAIDAFVEEGGGGDPYLARLLSAGVPFPDALEQCGSLLPRHVLPLVRVGWQSGALAPALRRAATIHDAYEPVWLSLFGRLAYLWILPAFAISILTFIMVWIIPQFAKIFQDFGIELPLITQRLISCCALISGSAWPLVLLLFIALLFLLVYSIMRYFGWVHWDLPGMGRLLRRADIALILDGLTLAADRQRPLLDAVAAMGECYPRWAVRRRLRQAAADIGQGDDWCESLYSRGLIRRADRGILQAATRVGNLPWALAELADSHRRRMGYRAVAVIQACFPTLIIVYGLAVMFIVVGLFAPLIAIIQRLT